MADHELVQRLMQSIPDWNQWRWDHPEIRPNLSRANLSHTVLSRADLSDAVLSRADLDYANLSSANLSRANLIGANLSDADLGNANLSDANLSHANLSRADLDYANLSSAKLANTVLSKAIVGWTILCDLDLRPVKRLETITHHGPSSIGTDTIIRSEGNIPEAFLRGAGLSDTFIEYVRSLVACPIEYYSCFLSYSNRDQNIVDRLYADLQSKGVRCWYAPHELKPGDYYRHEIDQSIRVYDKLVLILSHHSVESEWVEKEVSMALQREASLDMTRQVLFPLRLDNAAMESRRSWVRSLRYHRHIADFTCWKDHDAYLKAFERLLHDLQSNNPPTP